MTNLPISPRQPMIVKYVQSDRSGIHVYNLSRHCIGYVVRGKKYIYYGDVRHEINRGDLFYLGAGQHYTEDIPEEGKAFEQILFFYTPDQLQRILTLLSTSYGLDIVNDHSCKACRDQGHAICPEWSTMHSFFSTVNQYLKDGLFGGNEAAENLKMTELVYLILVKNDCCLKSKILDNVDLEKEDFEQFIRTHVFEDIPIEELARMSNRSLTSFKKEFKKHFFEPPHKWFIRQRLMHVRLLLISTNKSIAEIGIECNFPNTSHFIKLFKKEYGMTPAVYRNRHSEKRSLPDGRPPKTSGKSAKKEKNLPLV